MVDAVPDFVDQRLQDGIIGCMNVRIKALIKDVTLPDIAVDIMGGWKGEKGQTNDSGHNKDKGQLSPRGPINGKSPEKSQEKEK